MEDRKVLLSVKDLIVKFHVRGRVLTAIRGVSLDIYENESIAIVGESGSGKSVFTKTFAGMLDSNGFIDNGKIIFSDEELSDTVVKLNDNAKKVIAENKKKLDEYSRLEFGADTYKAILELESEKRRRADLSKEEAEAYEKELLELKHERTNTFNLKQTYDPSKEKDKIKEAGKKISELDTKIRAFEKEHEQKVKERANSLAHDTAYNQEFDKKMAELKAKHAKEVSEAISAETEARNEILAKEVYLSVGRFGFRKRMKQNNALLDALKEAMKLGVDLNDEEQRNAVFDKVTFRVKYLDENSERLHGICILNLANIRDGRDWSQIRGTKIATVFQDPMTSLNPLYTIQRQMEEVLILHEPQMNKAQRRERCIELLHAVGIPNPEERLKEYPNQFSGGMRQRVIIAIALATNPKLLIADEPTTALDVTIQEQILKLMKKLVKEHNTSLMLITHDLAVVSQMVDKINVMYCGKLVETGKTEDIIYHNAHPYTEGLLNSIPKLYEDRGCYFAPRCKYCQEICRHEKPQMQEVGPGHMAACHFPLLKKKEQEEA